MSITNQNAMQSLKQKIAESRRKLQYLWDSKNATDAEVLAAGEEFDSLMNEYQKLKN